MTEGLSHAAEKANDAASSTIPGALPAGTLPAAPETTNNPSSIQTRTRSHSRERRQGASTIAGDNSSGQSEHTSGYTENIPTHTGPTTLAGRSIPLGIRSTALSILLTFAPVRDVTSVSDGFHLNSISHSEAWVGQHVGREVIYPCNRCSRGCGPFLGTPCVIVDGHFKGACAGCHYRVNSGVCSLREPAASTSRIIMAGLDLPQQGKSPSVLNGISLKLEGKEAVVLPPFADIASKAIGGRSRSRSPVSHDSLGGGYESYLRRAREQSPRGRAISRRRLEAEIEAINQAEAEERQRERRERETRARRARERRERERREREREEGDGVGDIEDE